MLGCVLHDANVVTALAALPSPVCTAETLLERDPEGLASDLGVPSSVIEAFRFEVAMRFIPRRYSVARAAYFNTAADLSVPKYVKTTEAPRHACARNLRALLIGGIAMDEITEVVGPSGSGKTQFCFSIAAEAAATGSTVFYLDTTNSFNSSRSQEIARVRLGESATRLSVDGVVSRIRVMPAHNIFEALDILDVIELNASCNPYPGLLVVDSVTALAAPVLGGKIRSLALLGQALMGHLAAVLHRIARCNIGVVITNETRLESGPRPTGLRPALGRSWKFTASSRVFFSAVGVEITKHPRAVPSAHSTGDVSSKYPALR